MAESMLVALARHLGWADAEIWKTVLGAAQDPLDPDLRFRLHHLHTVQHAFLLIWQGEAIEVPEADDFADPGSLARWGRDAHARILEVLAGADPAELRRELDIPWTERIERRLGRPAEPVTLEQSAHQVVLHTAHHRGQIARRLRELDVEPPLIDFIAWLWQGKPAPSWPGQIGEDRGSGPAVRA